MPVITELRTPPPQRTTAAASAACILSIVVAAYVNWTHANHFQLRYLSERLHSDPLADSCVHNTERFPFSANAFDRDTITQCVWPAAQLTHRHPFDHDRARIACTRPLGCAEVLSFAETDNIFAGHSFLVASLFALVCILLFFIPHFRSLASAYKLLLIILFFGWVYSISNSSKTGRSTSQRHTILFAETFQTNIPCYIAYASLSNWRLQFERMCLMPVTRAETTRKLRNLRKNCPRHVPAQWPNFSLNATSSCGWKYGTNMLRITCTIDLKLSILHHSNAYAPINTSTNRTHWILNTKDTIVSSISYGDIVCLLLMLRSHELKTLFFRSL